MKHIDAFGHTRGESQYIDDIDVPRGTLFALPYASPVAHGKIKSINLDAARAAPGVHAILTARDIPGDNQIGSIVPDEELLAGSTVHFIGEPVALIIAESEELARKARRLISAEFEELPVITDPREAAQAGRLLIPPMVFESGNVDEAFAQCAHIFEGSAESGGQEHLYLEPQGALAVLTEDGGVTITSSTQGPSAVQRAAARILNLPLHKVDVAVKRIGGGFGGKEDQATAWACLAALGAFTLKRPVKLVLHRIDDMRMTGKRHPYSSDYKIGLSKEGKILALEAALYQNGGATADLSPPVLARSLFHINNSYCIPNLRATGYACKTNLPPNTAFRGFGGPQGMFIVEAALAHAARALGKETRELQKLNLLKEGDLFHYGQRTKGCNAMRCWEGLEAKFNLDKLYAEARAFNKEQRAFKKGIAVMPVCFGISFTKTDMNQAGALVHVYTDGSVQITSAAVEMGQGVTTKLAQTAATALGIPGEWVRIDTTSTSRIANTSPSAASSEPDLNGKAVEIACRKILDSIFETAREFLKERDGALSFRDGVLFCNGAKTEHTFKELVAETYLRRRTLSAHAHYATPGIHFDMKTNSGEPFAYHAYGTAVTGVTLDCLRGIYTVDYVKILHDFGKSFNSGVDIGQTEGGLVQGIGWLTLEEVVYNEKGKLLTDTFSTYKIPDLNSAPARIEIEALPDSDNPLGLMNSKAVGEPPLMYGIGAYFALEDALIAFNAGAAKDFACAPLSPERALRRLYPEAIAAFSA